MTPDDIKKRLTTEFDRMGMVDALRKVGAWNLSVESLAGAIAPIVEGMLREQTTMCERSEQVKNKMEMTKVKSGPCDLCKDGTAGVYVPSICVASIKRGDPPQSVRVLILCTNCDRRSWEMWSLEGGGKAGTEVIKDES